MRQSPAKKTRTRAKRRMTEAQYAAHVQRVTLNSQHGGAGDLTLAKAARTKYGNEKVFHDGMKFDSKRECRRWLVLVQRQAAGLIRDLQRQVAFVLAPAADVGGARRKPALRYFADFVYVDVATGERVVEDAKGKKTDMYAAKKHLMVTVHGILIREV